MNNQDKKVLLRSILFAVCVLATINFANAQQDAQYTQYMYNTMAVNPAYTGSRGVVSINALHRSQWVGVDGAPATQTFNIHGPVGNRVGLGLAVVNDEIGNGTVQETNFDASFSYTLPVGQNSKLSFGLKVGGHLLNIDFNQLRNRAPSVGSTGNESIDKRFSPNFGVGVYYHDDTFYTGLSIPNFLETTHFDGGGANAALLARERMNVYLISGLVLDFNPHLKFKPAILVKAVSGAPLQVDVSASVMFNDSFTLGAAYRLDAAVSGLLGFQVSDRLFLGLAYDRETSALGNTSFNNGSFEALLRYEFFNKNSKVKSSRFF